MKSVKSEWEGAISCSYWRAIPMAHGLHQLCFSNLRWRHRRRASVQGQTAGWAGVVPESALLFLIHIPGNAAALAAKGHGS